MSDPEFIEDIYIVQLTEELDTKLRNIMKLKCNCCDGIYKSIDVFFTSKCDNRCRHCIDKLCQEKRIANGLSILYGKPDSTNIAKTIIENSEKFEDVLFLGGEPLLYIKELLDCIMQIKNNTNLKCYVTTSMPKIAAIDNNEILWKLLDVIDGMTISVQHHNEYIADEIRQTTSKYDRHAFYKSIPNRFKKKIRIAANLVKKYFTSKDDVINLVKTYENFGFSYFKLTELQHAELDFVSFEDLFDIHMKSPYAYGCQTKIDLSQYGIKHDIEVLLKRSCFLVEESRNASIADGLKILYKKMFKCNNGMFMLVDNIGNKHSSWILN